MGRGVGSNSHNDISIDDETHINLVKSNCARKVITDPSISWVLGVRKIRTRTAPNFIGKNNEHDECGKISLRQSMLNLKRPWSAISEWHCCLTLTRFYSAKSNKSNNRSNETQSDGAFLFRILLCSEDYYTIAQPIHPDIKCCQSFCYQCLLYNQICEVLVSLLLCGRSPSYRALFYSQSSS